MRFTTALRLNMTGLLDDMRAEGERYRAALDMAAYVDAHGFDAVALEEHHCAENGWLPSPLTLAAAVAARTERVRISVVALLVTLYDPVRLAEDIAVLDLISDGRFGIDLDAHAQAFQFGRWRATDGDHPLPPHLQLAAVLKADAPVGAGDQERLHGSSAIPSHFPVARAWPVDVGAP